MLTNKSKVIASGLAFIGLLGLILVIGAIIAFKEPFPVWGVLGLPFVIAAMIFASSFPGHSDLAAPMFCALMGIPFLAALVGGTGGFLKRRWAWPLMKVSCWMFLLLEIPLLACTGLVAQRDPHWTSGISGVKLWGGAVGGALIVIVFLR